MRVTFQGRRKTGRLDLEALEMAVPSAMHRAGAAALTELLEFPTPANSHARWLVLAVSKPLTGSFCTTNRLERLEGRRRTNVIPRFPTEQSCLTLLYATNADLCRSVPI